MQGRGVYNTSVTRQAVLLPDPAALGGAQPPVATLANAATLLANCAVDPPFRQALLGVAATLPAMPAMSAMAGLVGGDEGGGAGEGGLGMVVDGLVLHALSPHTGVAQKASSALINLCNDPAFREL